MNEEIQQPYYDMRRREWVGRKPERRDPANPRCPKCGGLSAVHQYAILDSDGEYQPQSHRCLRCGEEF